MTVLHECRFLLLLAPVVFLLLPISVATFILERATNSLIHGQTSRNWRTGANELILPGANTTIMGDSSDLTITVSINSAPSFAIIGVCALAFIVLALDTFGIWELRKVGGTPGHERMWCWIVIVGNVVLLGVSVGVFGYMSSVQISEQGWNSIADAGNGSRDFMRETWACQVNKLYPSQDWAGTACGTATATRYLLLPLAFSALLVIVSVFFIARSRGGVKWLLGGKGCYAGFENVYEMQPAGYAPPYAAQPMPQYASQPHPQWVAQPVHYWQVHPAQGPQQWPSRPYQQALGQGPPSIPKWGGAVEQQEQYR